MSEWISREDREPPQYATPPVEVFIPKEATGHSSDRIIITSEPPCWPESTHWRTHVPPPRTVTIEISECTAKWYATADPGNCIQGAMRDVIEACAKALEEQR